MYIHLGDISRVYAVPEVNILNTGSQPDRPTRFRRDETRTFEASFSTRNRITGHISFTWAVNDLSFPPLNVSEKANLFLHNTLELNVERKGLQAGLKLVMFELRIAEQPMASRDFAFLQVDQSALVTLIAGGTVVDRSINKPIILDGTPSYDPEDEGRTRPLSFWWSCFLAQVNASDFNNPVANISVTDGPNNSTNSTTRLSAESGTQKLGNFSLHEISEESSLEILSKLTNVTRRNLVQLPNGVFTTDYPHNGKVTLDTTKLISNNKYYVLLTVHKGDRIAYSVQTLHIRDEELVDIEIR